MSATSTGCDGCHSPNSQIRSSWPEKAHLRDWTVIWLSLLGLLSTPATGQDAQNGGNQPYRVILFTGSEENVPFWKLFADFMQCSADDLGIQLRVFYANNDRERMAAELRRVCQRRNKPSAVVIQSFKESGERSLKIAERFRVPVFLVNAGLTEEQHNRLGAPRGKLRYWLGEMLPNDEDAGYQLANALIDEALRLRRVGADGRVHVIGINGAVADTASVERNAGLERAIAERPAEAKLAQVVSAKWARNLARQSARILHRRYPEAAVIWTASDHMAAGVIDAMGDLELVPGEDVIIGGVDGTPDGLELVRQGRLHATVGGHFMEGGWVTVLLHDFLKGVELSQIPAHPTSPMTLVTKTNLSDYQLALDPATWQRFNFLQLSRASRPDLKEYQFGTGVFAAVEHAERKPVDPTRESPTDDDGNSE